MKSRLSRGWEGVLLGRGRRPPRQPACLNRDRHAPAVPRIEKLSRLVKEQGVSRNPVVPREWHHSFSVGDAPGCPGRPAPMIAGPGKSRCRAWCLPSSSPPADLLGGVGCDAARFAERSDLPSVHACRETPEIPCGHTRPREPSAPWQVAVWGRINPEALRKATSSILDVFSDLPSDVPGFGLRQGERSVWRPRAI